MTAQDTGAFTAELANLRGDFARFGRDLSDIKTSCAVLVERSNRTEQDLRDLRRDMEEEIRKIREEEVKPLEAKLDLAAARQWPLPSAAVLVSAGALGVAVYQLVQR